MQLFNHNKKLKLIIVRQKAYILSLLPLYFITLHVESIIIKIFRTKKKVFHKFSIFAGYF